MGAGGKLILGGALTSTVEGEPLEIYLRDTAIGLAEELTETTKCLLSLNSDFTGKIVVGCGRKLHEFGRRDLAACHTAIPGVLR